MRYIEAQGHIVREDEERLILLKNHKEDNLQQPIHRKQLFQSQRLVRLV